MILASISQFSRQCGSYLTQFSDPYPCLYKTAYHGLCLGTALYFGQSLLGRVALLGATHAAGYAAKKAMSAFFPALTQTSQRSITSAVASGDIETPVEDAPAPLSFTGVELGDAYLQILKNQRVTQLFLTECPSISGEIVDHIISLLKSNKLTHLTLSYTQLTDSQVEALAEALSLNRSLQDCRLSFCIPSEEGIARIAKALTVHPTMHTLYLESNTTTGPTPVMAAVAELIKTNRVLQNLVFAYQMFQDPGSQMLAEALIENNHLKSLDLSNNAMTEEAFQLFQQRVADRSSLRISLPSSPSSFSFI